MISLSKIFEVIESNKMKLYEQINNLETKEKKYNI